MKITFVFLNEHWHSATQIIYALRQNLNEQAEKADIFVVPDTIIRGFELNHAFLSEDSKGQVFRYLLSVAQYHGCPILAGHITQESSAAFIFKLINYEDETCLSQSTIEELTKFAFYESRRAIFVLQGVLFCVLQDLRMPISFLTREKFERVVIIGNWPALEQDSWHGLLRAKVLETGKSVVACYRVGDDGIVHECAEYNDRGEQIDVKLASDELAVEI